MRKIRGTWESITSKNAYKTPLDISPPKASKLHDVDSVLSVVILTETHTRVFYEKSISPNHKKVAEQQEETHTYLLYVILCCPVQKQNHQSCHLIHHSIFPCNQKNPKPMSYDSLPVPLQMWSVIFLIRYFFLNFKTIYLFRNYLEFDIVLR